MSWHQNSPSSHSSGIRKSSSPLIIMAVYIVTTSHTRTWSNYSFKSAKFPFGHHPSLPARCDSQWITHNLTSRWLLQSWCGFESWQWISEVTRWEKPWGFGILEYFWYFGATPAIIRMTFRKALMYFLSSVREPRERITKKCFFSIRMGFA